MSEPVNVSPKAESLAEHFKKWQVPTEKDFHALINLALEAPIAGPGLKEGITDNGVANAPENVKPLAVKLEKNAGMMCDINHLLGFYCGDDTGITVTADNNCLCLNVKENNGLDKNKGVHVKVTKDAGLSVTANGVSLSVNEAKGLVLRDKKLSLNLNSQSFSVSREKGCVCLKLKPGGGLKIDEKTGHLTVDVTDIVNKLTQKR